MNSPHSPINRHREKQPTKQQVVAGCIVFRRTEEGIKYLLLYRRGGYWNFPKGHFEAGEDALQVALRETQEETGIQPESLKISPGFRTHVRFNFKADGEEIHDTVIFFLAETKEFHITLREREHSGSAWFVYRDAMRILGRYVGTKRALTEANQFLIPPASTLQRPKAPSPTVPPGVRPPNHSRPNPRFFPRYQSGQPNRPPSHPLSNHPRPNGPRPGDFHPPSRRP